MHATWSLVSALYHPTECQVLTLALDAQLCYWEVIDGKEIRHLVLGKHSSVTALDVSHDGESFMTATDSSLIKVYPIQCFYIYYVGLLNIFFETNCEKFSVCLI